MSEKENMKKQNGAEEQVEDASQTEQAAAENAGGESGEPAEQTPPEKTEAELLQEKVDSLNDQLLRTMAEYDNYRKRSQRERDAIYPQATAAAVGQFVTILDTFDRALEAPCSDPEFKKGVEMILNNFKEALKKLGVEEFGAKGEPFNADLHNAVMHVENDENEAGTIVEVYQKGYRLGDRVIRHAMVTVAN